MAETRAVGKYDDDSCLHCRIGRAIGGALKALGRPIRAEDALEAMMLVAGDIIAAECNERARDRLYAMASIAMANQAGLQVEIDGETTKPTAAGHPKGSSVH